MLAFSLVLRVGFAREAGGDDPTSDSTPTVALSALPSAIMPSDTPVGE
jgi:hypothetical protein